MTCTILPPEALLPASWSHFSAAGPVRAFNPGLLRDGAGWILAYRIVGADGLRRIGVCRLDRDLKVKPGSALPLTDQVKFRRNAAYPAVVQTWFADPRLYRFNGRVFIYWNSGWHEPRNYQFLQELDAASLAPIGHPRELVLCGDRQKLEKNWTLFGDRQGQVRAVYSITPHRILTLSLDGEGDIPCDAVSSTDWSLLTYPAHHGGLRGGAPPVWFADRYWSFGHTVHDGTDGYCYAPAAYAFAAEPPYAPAFRPTRPLALGEPGSAQRKYPRLNPAVDRVIYPCGAAHDGTRWIISHGINDEHCALTCLDHNEVLATVEPVPGEQDT